MGQSARPAGATGKWLLPVRRDRLLERTGALALVGWFFLASPPARAAEPGSTTEWTVSEEKDSMYDTPTVVLRRPAENTAEALVVQCYRDKTSVALEMKHSLSKYPATLLVRLDDKEPEYETFGFDWGHLFFRDPIQMARRLAKGKRMAIELQLPKDLTQIVYFDLSGLEQLLPKVAAACKWKIRSRANDRQ